MGVQGLWKLLESTGKPIPVERLENKVLSIDVSIWMYQIIKGVQESDHGATTNGHLIVMFHRICKLLFYGIKPVFVFDGSVPELKKLTIAQRQAQKSRAKKSSGKTKEKILKNMLEQAALKSVMNAGQAPTEDEVISKTVKRLNKETEADLFELPSLPETFEIEKTKSPIKEKERPYPSSVKGENILLLAVENQDNDFMYGNSAKDKEKPSPEKLNTFSSLQIGELLNGYSDDQRRLSERKKQQKSKHEMTFNELEMFLNDNNDAKKNIDEFSQKIDSDHDTVFYYESDVKKAAKSSSSSEKDKTPKVIKMEKTVETESEKKSQKKITTDTIGSPTLTEDIDEDIFKALAGDESLEEDRLAWLIFNENKKASKRRSSEFESPNSKYLKPDTNNKSSEYTSDLEEDVSVKNNKNASKKRFSESIFITEDDVKLDDFKEEDYLSWVSHTKDEPDKVKLEEKKSYIDHLNVPSTSKSLSPMKEDDTPKKKQNASQRNINTSSYFESKTESEESYMNSPEYHQSDFSNGSFSDNSLAFSSEESLFEENTTLLDKQIKEKSAAVQHSSNKWDSSKVVKTEETKTPNNCTITEKLKSSKNKCINTKLPKPLESDTSNVDEEYLLSIQDSLVKRQNDLVSLHSRSNRIASSVTQKITSEIKCLLKLFGIPYITAPMEAEAQCVFLEKNGRTEGTITDDSDVWLFGANIVYKDFFDSQKYVKQFKSIEIKQKFTLSQNSLIQLAFLVGSDYTNGIDGIGPVTAIEILSFFESKTKNMNIEDKLLRIKEIINSKSEVYSDLPFMKKLKSAKIGSDFPNKAVINAYLNPIVNESNVKFSWDAPQVDSIIQFAQTNFDWDVSKTKNTLAPVLKKVSARTTQRSLDSFVKTLPKLSNTNSGMSKRVSLAVKRMHNDQSSVEPSNKNSPDNSKILTSAVCNDRDKKRRKNPK